MGDLLQIVEDGEQARAIEARRILARNVVLASAPPDDLHLTEFHLPGIHNQKDHTSRSGGAKGGKNSERNRRIAALLAATAVGVGLIYMARKKGVIKKVSRPFTRSATGVGKLGDKELLDAEKSVKTWKALGGGRSAATVELGVTPDGRQLIRKLGLSRAEADKEFLTAKMGQALGSPVPNAVRVRGGLLLERAPGSTQGNWGQGPLRRIAQKFGKGSARRSARANGARELGLLDYLSNNTDRRAGNFMLDGGKPPSVFGIDHSATFWPQAALNKQFPLTPFSGAHVRGRRFPPAEVARIRRQMEALKPEFVRTGRMGWYTRVMQRVDSLETGARFDGAAVELVTEIQMFQGKDAARGSGKIGIFFVDVDGDEEALGTFEVLDGRITRANGDGVAEFLTHVKDGNDALKKYSNWSNGWIVTRLMEQ